VTTANVGVDRGRLHHGGGPENGKLASRVIMSLRVPGIGHHPLVTEKGDRTPGVGVIIMMLLIGRGRGREIGDGGIRILEGISLARDGDVDYSGLLICVSTFPLSCVKYKRSWYNCILKASFKDLEWELYNIRDVNTFYLFFKPIGSRP
jgi:hypothetical protein